MSKPNLYAFFCAEKSNTKFPIVEINIDSSLNTIYEIYYNIGKQLYKDYPYDNPILAGDKYFFGASPDGFNDCLTDYLNLRNTEITLRFNIFSQGKDISNADLYIFLECLAFVMLHYDYDSRLQVYVSKEILRSYLKESDRLLTLDTDPEDYVVY